jgi:purine-binding chemotaxis protein CheW
MSSESQARQLVVFTLGSEQYAPPIEQVHEIIRYDEPRSVASRIEWVRGVISLRGRIVPVYDLAARLGLKSELTDQTKIVIVEFGSETAGVIVDDVEEVLTIDGQQFEEVPGADAQLIDSIAKIGDRLVVLLKPTTIFTGLELATARRRLLSGSLSAARSDGNQHPDPRRRRRRQRDDATDRHLVAVASRRPSGRQRPRR